MRSPTGSVGVGGGPSRAAPRVRAPQVRLDDAREGRSARERPSRAPGTVGTRWGLTYFRRIRG